jgi:hypothetical protein
MPIRKYHNAKSISHIAMPGSVTVSARLAAGAGAMCFRNGTLGLRPAGSLVAAPRPTSGSCDLRRNNGGQSDG